MRIRAAESKRVDPRQPRLIAPRQLNRFSRDLKIEIVKRDVRVQLVDMKAGRIDTVFQRHLRLQQAHQAGGRLQMPKVRLGGADRQWQRPMAPEHFANRRRLHRIADRGAGAMRLKKRQIVSVELQFAHHLTQQISLPVRRRHRHANGAPIGIHAAAQKDAAHRIMVVLRHIHPAQHKRHRAFGTDITVRAAVKRLAQPFRRQHRRAGKPDKSRRLQQRVHTTYNRRINLSGAQGLNRLMHGVKRGRARRIDRETRPFQIEQIRDPVRNDGQRVPRHELTVDRRQIAQEPPGMVRRRRPDIHPRLALGQRRRRQPGMLHRFPHRLQQDPLLWVHLHGLTRGNPEEPRVKPPDVIQLPRRKGVRRPQSALVAVQKLIMAPPVRLSLGDHASARRQHIPERGGRGRLRQFTRIA